MKEIIINQFVPFEIADALLDKGFNEDCLGYYESRDNKFICRDVSFYELEKYDLGILAPTLQQVIDWLSDVHNIEVDAMRYTYRGGVYQGKCYMWFVDQYDPKYNHELEENDSHWILNERKAQGYDFKTKREAIQTGIVEAITLI
jgi:hypothetical protein